MNNLAKQHEQQQLFFRTSWISDMHLGTPGARAEELLHFLKHTRSDTLYLVLLEALACGLPVAAYPVTGPVDVIGNSDAGCLDDDLKKAVESALKLSSQNARRHAERFSWQSATSIFYQHLVPVNKVHSDKSIA